jgi:hypothetical protein
MIKAIHNYGACATVESTDPSADSLALADALIMRSYRDPSVTLGSVFSDGTLIIVRWTETREHSGLSWSMPYSAMFTKIPLSAIYG